CLDPDAHAHVVGAAGGALAPEGRILAVVLTTDTAQVVPLAEPTADPGSGALAVDDALPVLTHAVVIAADADVDNVAGNAGGYVEALVDVAVLGVLVDLAVGADAGAGQRHALADLDQSRVALGGLHLLGATAAAVGGATQDAHLVAA